jgi:hypothetical protein
VVEQELRGDVLQELGRLASERAVGDRNPAMVVRMTLMPASFRAPERPAIGFGRAADRVARLLEAVLRVKHGGIARVG